MLQLVLNLHQVMMHDLASGIGQAREDGIGQAGENVFSCLPYTSSKITHHLMKVWDEMKHHQTQHQEVNTISRRPKKNQLIN